MTWQDHGFIVRGLLGVRPQVALRPDCAESRLDRRAAAVPVGPTIKARTGVTERNPGQIDERNETRYGSCEEAS